MFSLLASTLRIISPFDDLFNHGLVKGVQLDESTEEAVYNKTVKLLHFFSCIFNILGDYPSGVKIAGQNSSVRGRGITRLLESISSSSSNIHKFSNCETPVSPYTSPKHGYKSFSSLS